jgi:TonB family protein
MLSSARLLQIQPIKKCVSSKRFLFLVLGFVVALAPFPLRADERAIVHKVAPVYPEVAKRMHISGTVRVLTTVDAAGAVLKAEGQGSNKLLSGAAEDAVKRWKFAPSDGTSTLTIQINFENQ